METFWKAIAVTILTVILCVAIGKTEKEFSVVLAVSACCIVLMVAMQYLSQVVIFLRKLWSSVDYQNPFMETLIKITGVSLITELSCLIGSDAGNSSLGKAIQMLGKAAILFLALPLFESFLSIIQEIMGFL